MSRTRLIRPEFFSDPVMGALSVATRLTYVGLWTLCDDDGYFELDSPQIAAELYRYEPVARRQKAVDKALDELAAAGRVRFLECGEHGMVPTIPDHRIKGGEALHTVKKRHDRRCYVGLREKPEDSLSVYESESVSDSVLTIAQARAKKEQAERLAAFRRQGLPVDV